MSETSTPRAKISAFVVCCNEADHIERCLSSVSFCDEIIVVDSGSTDETIPLARRYTDRIIQRTWPGFVAQKRYALEQCSHEWILNIDADEEVSTELRAEILDVLERSIGAPTTVADGYELPRVVFYLGRWWRKGGWYPEHRLRLCRKERTSWGGDDPHERAVVTGKVTRLFHELHHFTYDDLADHVRSHNSLSTAAAPTVLRKSGGFLIMKMLVHPWGRFFRFYFLRRGYREGFAGLLVAILEGYYAFLKYAKAWELRRRAESSCHRKDNAISCSYWQKSITSSNRDTAKAGWDRFMQTPGRHAQLPSVCLGS